MNKNIQYKKLTDICEIITGEWGTEITENSQNIVSVIRTTNFLNNGKIDIQNKELIKREIDKKKLEQKQLKRGDIIIEKSGGSPNQPVGRVVFFDLNSNEVFLCNNFTSILRVKEDINSKYIFYFFRNNYKKNKVVKYQNKTTGIINLKLQNYLNESCIFLPELKIQNKIVNILDNLENIIEKNQNYLTHLGVLTKSLFTTMFGDPFSKVINKEEEKSFLKDITIINPSKKEIEEIKSNLEISFITMADISEDGQINVDNIKKLEDVKNNFTFFKENDVLFAKITPCMENGKGGVAKSLKNNIGFGTTEIHVLRPISNITNSQWIYHLTKLPLFRKDAEIHMTGSAGQKRVPTTYLANFKIKVPPIELQNKFAERIEKIEKLKFEIEKSIEIAQNLYDSLISKYFDN